MNLAKAAVQNNQPSGFKDRAVFHRIADTARMLIVTKAPENYWAEILEDGRWEEEED